MFESAADAFGEALIGVVLTGANTDGAQRAQSHQAARWACRRAEPRNGGSILHATGGARATAVDHIVDLERIALLLRRLCQWRTSWNRHGRLKNFLRYKRHWLHSRQLKPNILIVDDRKENLLATEKVLRPLRLHIQGFIGQ